MSKGCGFLTTSTSRMTRSNCSVDSACFWLSRAIRSLNFLGLLPAIPGLGQGSRGPGAQGSTLAPGVCQGSKTPSGLSQGSDTPPGVQQPSPGG